MMVIARVFGGLGNQLFIYAAARRLALVNGVELILDDISGFTRDYQFQRHYQLEHFNIPCRKATASERLEPFSRARRYLKRLWNGRMPFEQRTYILENGRDFDSRLLFLRPRGTLYLEGYWQSEGYFKDVESQIREDLRITAPGDADNQKMAVCMASTRAVAVHVRFFDEPASGNDPSANNAPGDYYQRAIQVLEQLLDGGHYFIFSDRPQAARSRIPLPDDRVTLVHHNQGDVMAYADLWLMTQCKYFIIANSTFSWWGAWLAAHPDKVVIAPGFEEKDGEITWGFEGLIPDSWIKC